MKELIAEKKTGRLEISSCLSEVEIIYKTKVKSVDRKKINKSSDAYEVFMNCFDMNVIEHHEEMKLILLNRANQVLGWAKISQGGLIGTVVDRKIVLQLALTTNASSIVLCHNHPSGNLKPSETDIKITKELQAACKLLEIVIIDHLIITSEGYLSMADDGYLD